MTVAILDIGPDPIYSSETLESGHAPGEIGKVCRSSGFMEEEVRRIFVFKY